jgi:hypothetical protein
MEKSFDFIFFEKYEDTIETKFLEMGKWCERCQKKNDNYNSPLFFFFLIILGISNFNLKLLKLMSDYSMRQAI